MMLKAGDRSTDFTSAGWNILHYAAQGRNINVVKSLYKTPLEALAVG